jgi:tetratricopeptide (TPR) repeat protein
VASVYASVLRYRSFLSHSLGRLNEAIEFHKQALARDPLLAGSHSYLAFLLYCAGRYDEAETELQRALELNPPKTYDRFTRGEILLQRHRPLEALTENRARASGDLEAHRRGTGVPCARPRQ